MNNSQLRGSPFSATASGTSSANASTTLTNVRYYVTDVSGTSTTAGTWALLAGTTIFWQGIGNIEASLRTAIPVPTTGTISFLMNGATLSFANISGYYI